MYRHLLVPLDDTDLSIEVVGNAVGLARAVGARITFFHAVAGHAGSLQGGADIVRTGSPDQHAYACTGKAWELLAKAEAAARAFGVPCDSKGTASDKPAAAIVQAAHGQGCDLIFMASHGAGGRPGLAPASTTLEVLANARLPVLVSDTDEPGPPARAIGIIRDEHRSLAAVLHAWMQTLGAVRNTGAVADARLMRAIVRYLEVFTVALHHRKEEDHLFRRLRGRTSSVDAELDELERQHLHDRQLVADLAQGVDTLATASGEAVAGATRALDDAVRSYASFVWEHLGREEGVILPAAQHYLTAADWCAIETEFLKNREPRFGGDADTEARQLFSRIVNTIEPSQ